jgi:hypothetical protein
MDCWTSTHKQMVAAWLKLTKSADRLKLTKSAACDMNKSSEEQPAALYNTDSPTSMAENMNTNTGTRQKNSSEMLLP